MNKIDMKVLKGYVEGKDTMKELLVPAIVKLIKENEKLKEKNSLLALNGNNVKTMIDVRKNYILKTDIEQKFNEKLEEINNENLNYSEDEYWLESEIKGYAMEHMRELLDNILK